MCKQLQQLQMQVQSSCDLIINNKKELLKSQRMKFWNMHSKMPDNIFKSINQQINMLNLQKTMTNQPQIFANYLDLSQHKELLILYQQFCDYLNDQIHHRSNFNLECIKVPKIYTQDDKDKYYLRRIILLINKNKLKKVIKHYDLDSQDIYQCNIIIEQEEDSKFYLQCNKKSKIFRMHSQDYIIFNASAIHWVTNCSPNRKNLCFLFKRVNNKQIET